MNSIKKDAFMGNEAIALALIHSNVQISSGYPGSPTSEILSTIKQIYNDLNINNYAEWSINEKVAFEIAYAGAITGKRTSVTMKQVGLNVASDALMSASYIGNIGGMLLVVADDPGFYSSQTEQDSREFAKFARIPVLDPSTPQDAYDLTKIGFEISEEFQVPVMLRPVMRVCHAREIIEVCMEDDNSNSGGFKREPTRWAAVPRDSRFLQGVAQLERTNLIALYNWDIFLNKEFEKYYGGELLIIASGVPYGVVKETLSDLALACDIVKVVMPYPLPVKKIKEQFGKYQKVLIVEETYPCIEDQLHSKKVFGKLTNTIQKIDEMSKESILKALQDIGFYQGKNIYEVPKIDIGYTIPPRPPILCQGCPHGDIYDAIMEVFDKEISIYPSDIGCYTLALAQGAIDSYLCMGASVSMASGFYLAEPEKQIVATIGDGTFFHSGIAPLINAVSQNHHFVLLILDNSAIAMTGRQGTPETMDDNIDIKKIVEGIGIPCLEMIYSRDQVKNVNFMKMVKSTYANNQKLPTVVVVREYCILDKSPLPSIFEDEKKYCELCNDETGCTSMCMNFEIPMYDFNIN